MNIAMQARPRRIACPFTPTPWVGGIDEAGYGPLLGPLVISGLLVRAREPLHPEGKDLWKRLAPVVVRPKRPAPPSPASEGARGKRPAARRRKVLPYRTDGRIEIADSKLVYSPARGTVELERAALALAGWGAERPITHPAQLLQRLVWLDPEAFREPWHAMESGPFPLNAAAGFPAVPIPHTSASPQLLLSRVFPASSFNRACERTQNKAGLALEVVTDVLARMWERAGDERLVVTVDRQSNRKEYAPALAERFAGATVEVLVEQRTYSAYRVTAGRRCLEVAFRVEAEQGSWPVAAASLLSKYLRELAMDRLNRFFHQHHPELRGTAGYYNDARRWLRDTAALRRRLGVEDAHFVRQR